MGGGKLLVSVTAAILLFAAAGRAQSYSDTLSIYFPQGKSDFDKTYSGNGDRADAFVKDVRSVLDWQDGEVRSMHFEVTCSPEGGREINSTLVRQRAESVRRWIERNLDISDIPTDISLNDSPWEELLEKVTSYRGAGLPDRERTVEILAEAVRNNSDGKSVQQTLSPQTWKYLLDNIFPELRRFRVVLVVDYRSPNPFYDPEAVYLAAAQIQEEIINPQETPFAPLPIVSNSVPKMTYTAPEPVEIASICLKTNVVALAMLVGNAAVELTISDRLSINFPIYYSGLDWFSAKAKFRTVAFLPELRYNFSSAETDALVQGFYAGIHAGIAWYNFAFNGDWRIQDADGKNPAIGGGVSIGYRMPVIKSIPGLGLEFNLGAGIYSLKYDKFYNESNGPLSRKGIKETRVLPDAVSISLYYRFDNHRRGGRSSR